MQVVTFLGHCEWVLMTEFESLGLVRRFSVFDCLRVVCVVCGCVCVCVCVVCCVCVCEREEREERVERERERALLLVIIEAISIAQYLTDKGEHTALYKISNSVCSKPQ